MFISADFLAIQYGVDDAIAKFFVDRKPPENNLYWKGKELYLRKEPGWLFIPLIVDLLFRIGIPRQQLLSENFVNLLESVGHVSAEEELNLINADEALTRYTDLVKTSYERNRFYDNLIEYMHDSSGNLFQKSATPFKALHRGDAFLFSICALSFNKDLDQQIVQLWFALITTLLLLDDAEDIEIDQINNHENAFIESGLSRQGLQEITNMVKSNLELLQKLNRPLSIKLEKSFQTVLSKPIIQNILNEQHGT